VGPYPVFQYYDAFGNLGYHGDTVTWGYAPFPPVAGKVYGKYYGRTLFIHSNALGSTGTTTWQDGTWGNSEIYDPWGQRWATSGTLWDERFAGIDNVRDPESGLDQTQFRMLTSSYGRWLSPDPLAGDVSNPQSLNRYAYALNNPCSMVDPLGLDACNINTLIDNQAGQSVNVAAIESVIAQIFGASSLGQPDQVGVNFVTGGPANFTLTYNNNGVAGKRSGYATPGGNTGVVFANLYPVSVYGQHADTFLGVIGAHEMGHGLASVKDLPFQNGDVPALMSIDNNPSWDIPVSNGSFPEGLLFTPGQVEAMFHRCPNKHPSVVPLPLGGGGGGGQGGSDRGQWQMTIGNCGTTSGDGGQGWTCDIGYTWVPFPIQRK
jgi:RHS repeat-associated protein